MKLIDKSQGEETTVKMDVALNPPKEYQTSCGKPIEPAIASFSKTPPPDYHFGRLFRDRKQHARSDRII